MAEDFTESDIQVLIQQIYQQSQWATEATAEMIYREQASTYSSLAQRINKMKDLKGDDRLNENLDAVIAEFQNQGKGIMDRMQHDTAQDVMSMARATDPIEGLMQGQKAIGGLIGNVADGLKGWGKAEKPGVGSAFTGLLDGGSKFLIGTGALGSAAGAYLMSQEKQLRTMIEFGVIAADVNSMTDLRGLAANVGMSMAELAPILDQHKGFLTNTGGSAMQGSRQFLRFADAVESGEMGITDFGYNTKELTKRLAEEADMLYKFGEVQTLDNKAKADIAERFATTSQMTTFLAGITGKTRKEMTKLREDAQKDINFIEAFNRNGDIIAKNFGAAAKKNVMNAQGEIAQLSEVVLGPEFRSLMLQNFNETVADFHLDQSPINNANRELLEQLNLMGADVAQQYIHIMEQSTTGKLVGKDLTMEFQKFQKMIANSPTLKGNSPTIRAINSMIMRASAVKSTNFATMTDQEMATGLKTIPAATEIADKSIDAVDDFAKGMKMMEHKILPGFEGMSYSFEKINTGLGLFGEGINFLLGGTTKDELTERVQSQFEVYSDLMEDRKDELQPITEKINNLTNQKMAALEKMKGFKDGGVRQKLAQKHIDRLDKKIEDLKGDQQSVIDEYAPKINEAKKELDAAKSDIYKDQNVRGDMYKIGGADAKSGSGLDVADQYDRGLGQDGYGFAPDDDDLNNQARTDIATADKAGGTETDIVTEQTVTNRRNAKIVEIETGKTYPGAQTTVSEVKKEEEKTTPIVTPTTTVNTGPDDGDDSSFLDTAGEVIDSIRSWWNSFWPEDKKKEEKASEPVVIPDKKKVVYPEPSEKSVLVTTNGRVRRYTGFDNELDALMWAYKKEKEDLEKYGEDMTYRERSDATRSIRLYERGIKRYGGPDYHKMRMDAAAEKEAKRRAALTQEERDAEDAKIAEARKASGLIDFYTGGYIDAFTKANVGELGPEMFVPNSFNLDGVQAGVGNYLDTLTQGQSTDDAKAELYKELNDLEGQISQVITDINKSQKRANSKEINYGRYS